MATYNYGGAPYMKRLADDRLRSLPGSDNKTGPPDESVPQQAQKASILEQYGLPADYTYLKYKPDQHSEKWKQHAVNRVVDHYLQAATLGGNPMEPQPHVMCECCMEINNESKRRKTGTHLDNGAEQSIHERPTPGTKPTTPDVSHSRTPVPQKPSKQVRFTHPGGGDYQEGDGHHYNVPFFRSEHDGPEMVAPGRYTGPDPDEDALEARTLFVTHPARKALYSEWGVLHEVGGYGQDRHMAEDVVEASSKYIDAMQRLRKMGKEDEY